MSIVLGRRKMVLAESLRRQGISASVEEMPDYRVRTPLQAAVMILKRHRDNTFANDPNLKPISVIIATLAGHAYSEQDTIASALDAILANMDKYVFHDGSKYIVPNPTDNFENFADKWEAEPEKADAFFHWLETVRRDFNLAVQATTLQGINESISTRLGKSLTERAMTKINGTSGGLLRTASVAPAATIPSFSDQPRVPTKPAGFA